VRDTTVLRGVLLVEVRLVRGICSILIFKEVRAVAMGRNVV
jgi:hypothetical protein